MDPILRFLVSVLVIGLLTASAIAVEPPMATVKFSVADPQYHETPPPGPPVFFSDACPATDVGMLATDGSITIPGDTCTSANDYENDGNPCSYGSGGNDEIFQFTVDSNGTWQFDTFNICAGWDTSLMVREETGGGCPGDWLACDGDSGHPFCGNFESAVQVFLTTGTTYYLVVDGWSSGTCGAFEVVAFSVGCHSGCIEDADCDDGLFCTGAETCSVGECIAGTYPCMEYQLCDEMNDVCVDPDPCISWLGGPQSGYFFPYADFTPGAWLADDIELERACTDSPAVLNYYEIPMIARPIQNPEGTVYFLDLALWEVEPLTCLPLPVPMAGTLCSGLSDDIDASGSPADTLHCAPGPVFLPDNSGDFNRCEIDFFAGYLGDDLGVGFSIGGGQQTIGGPAADNDYGVSVFFLEEPPDSGIWHPTWFGDDVNTPGDFEELTVCTENVGLCCEGLDACDTTIEADCAGVWTPCVFWDVPACDDPDGDGLFTICGDNCPGAANLGQEDCDGGVTPEGDACETNPNYADDDGDGACNCSPDPAAEGGDCDDCDSDPNKVAPGICGCGVADVDTDGDGAYDCEEECDTDPTKIAPGQCGCGTPDTESDGDGVADCNDQCPGVDDAVFAPECADAIPAMSQWGLIILALLLLATGKAYFGRRQMAK